MISFIKRHGPAAAIGFAVGFGVGGLTGAGKAVKDFLLGPDKPGSKGVSAENVVKTEVK